jgi:MFS family permease
VLTATILGSSMAFIDSTVVNVALPALQSNLHAHLETLNLELKTWLEATYSPSSVRLSTKNLAPKKENAAAILVGGALGVSWAVGPCSYSA